MYSNTPPADYPQTGQSYPSRPPPSDYGTRYSHGPPQQPYPQAPVPTYAPPPPQHDPPSFPSSVVGGPYGASIHGGNNPPAAVAGGIATAHPMDVYTISQFITDTQAGTGTCPFEVEGVRKALLQVNFGCPSTAGGSLQQIYMKKGSMVAYRGDIKFEREGMMERGMVQMLKKAVSSEGSTLVKATSSGGKSQLYLADSNKVVTVIQLQGESITVNGDDLLAFEPSLEHKIIMMKKLSAIVSGGLFNVKLSGKGSVAILSHGKPLTLIVRQGLQTVYTDPEATVAWSGNLNPDFNTDVQFKTFLGRGSGESFQMKFDPRKGEGFVVIQPYEEIVRSNGSISGAILR